MNRKENRTEQKFRHKHREQTVRLLFDTISLIIEAAKILNLTYLWNLSSDSNVSGLDPSFMNFIFLCILLPHLFV